MKIILPNDFLLRINQQNFKLLINIIKVKKSSTLISIKGKTLEIPYTLNNNLKYIAEIKDNVLYIYQRKIKTDIKENTENKKKLFNKISKFLNKLYLSENKKKFVENEINYLLFNELYSKINNEKQKKGKYKNFFLNNKNGDDFYFIFNLPFYNNLTKIFIKVDINRNVYLKIFSDKLTKEDNNDFIMNLRDSMKITAKSLIVNFYENIEDFYENIFKIIDVNKIDIKI